MLRVTSNDSDQAQSSTSSSKAVIAQPEVAILTGELPVFKVPVTHSGKQDGIVRALKRKRRLLGDQTVQLFFEACEVIAKCTIRLYLEVCSTRMESCRVGAPRTVAERCINAHRLAGSRGGTQGAVEMAGSLETHIRSDQMATERGERLGVPRK